jgi:hypothetical protein
MQEQNTPEPIVATAAAAPAPIAPVTAAPAEADNDKTLRLIAFILNIVTTVGVGWTIIPLAWMIPMTVISHGIYKGTKKNTTTFGVCTLLFMNLASGILLLVSKKDD